MKQNRKLGLTLIVLVIILLSLISFGGVFVQNKSLVENKLPEYLLAGDLKGYRRVELKVSDEISKTIRYDEQGQVISDEDTETKVAKTEEIKVNSDEILTKENFRISKNIIEKRLKAMNVQNYIIRQNEENGTIILELPENEQTDRVVGQLYTQAKFEIVDNDTNEVLMNNDDIKSVKAKYGTVSSGKTAVFVDIQFNKQGTEKFKNITNTYVETNVKSENVTEGEEAEEKKVTKKIALKIDDYSMLTTYFDQEVNNGVLQLSVGYSDSNTSSTKELQEYIEEANSMATILDSGKMPIVYEVEQNKFIVSNITENEVKIGASIVAGLLVIGFLYLVIKYKSKGILASVSVVGYLAILLIALRYFNVEITVSGLFTIALSIILNYIVMVNILKTGNVAKTVGKYTLIYVPLLVISVVFTFANIAVGAVLFWGIVINLLYNLSVSNLMLK